MVAIKTDNGIEVKNDIPKKWGEVHNYHKLGNERHKEDGFFPVAYPEILEGQKRGAIYFDAENEVFSYSVEDKSQSEIENIKISQAEGNRFQKLQELQEKKIMQEVNAIEDEAELLAMADVFPVWKEGIEVKVNEKIRGFLDGELVLFKVIQGHTTQADWKPENTPALFIRIAEEGEILDFVQPTGAHDAYNTGDKVNFEGQTWRSKVDNNIYSPTAYPPNWELV